MSGRFSVLCWHVTPVANSPWNPIGKTICSINNWSISKSHKGRNLVSGRVSVPCLHATPVVNVPWKPIGKTGLNIRSISKSHVMPSYTNYLGQNTNTDKLLSTWTNTRKHAARKILRHHKDSTIHIDNITNKANRSLGFIKRNIKTKYQKTREMAYNKLVRPQVEYASCVWDPYVKHHINKIEMVQRRAARLCCNDYSPYSSVSDMIDKLGWQTFQQRRSTSRLVVL